MLPWSKATSSKKVGKSSKKCFRILCRTRSLKVAHEASNCACAIQDDGQLGVTSHTSDTEHLPKALTGLIEALQSITTRQMAQFTGSWADPAPEPEEESSDEEAS